LIEQPNANCLAQLPPRPTGCKALGRVAIDCIERALGLGAGSVAAGRTNVAADQVQPARVPADLLLTLNEH
jgi:hypothetical protein